MLVLEVLEETAGLVVVTMETMSVGDKEVNEKGQMFLFIQFISLGFLCLLFLLAHQIFRSPNRVVCYSHHDSG